MGVIRPERLPNGVWQGLFQQALKLVGEIRRGADDPFFTFGGGTVLMLRYGHRQSKDIDLFVPDPQSLGFVTPRLSDVAESLCAGRYTEAHGFVKLFLEDGEIDVVASPNLLPKEHAYEEWELFGSVVRVETAAEIVAKKIYHRGHEGKARDLFDLALVVEREPEALALAQPFLFRHAAEFLAAIRAPSAAFVHQFESIDTLGYSPSLDQAVECVENHFANVRVAVDASLGQARDFALSNGYSAETVDTTRGQYYGKLLFDTPHHLVQHLGRDKVAIHEKHRLGLMTPAAGGEIHVQYAEGIARAITPAQKVIER